MTRISECCLTGEKLFNVKQLAKFNCLSFRLLSLVLISAERGGGREAGQGGPGFRPARLGQRSPGTSWGPQCWVFTCCSTGTTEIWSDFGYTTLFNRHVSFNHQFIPVELLSAFCCIARNFLYTWINAKQMFAPHKLNVICWLIEL